MMLSYNFNPLQDMPDLSGKVVVVTGEASGVGAETIKQLSVHSPSKIFLTGPNTRATDNFIGNLRLVYPHIQFRFVPCDMSDLSSVRRASNRIAARTSRIDLFFCNTGLMSLPSDRSNDGYNKHFATNHLGHALLIDLLMPVLEDAASLPGSDVRIMITTSQASAPPLMPKHGIDFDALKTEQETRAGRRRRHAQSRLANLLYARALDKQYPFITAVSIHPGTGYTGLQDKFPIVDRFIMWASTMGKRSSVDKLAWNGLWAATAPKGEEEGQVQGGAHYEPVGKRPMLLSDQASKELEEELWNWTQGELQAWELKAGIKF